MDRFIPEIIIGVVPLLTAVLISLLNRRRARQLLDRLTEKVEVSAHELMVAYEQTVFGWSKTLDMRDNETAGHSHRVMELTLRFAKALKYTGDYRYLRYGALLHDIGKMRLPDNVLKKNGSLDVAEWVEMKKHPEYAHEMLSEIAYLRPALEIPCCHHERYDGGGYPRGLKAENIPFGARLFSIVDVYDALTNDRVYRKAFTHDAAIEIIRAGAGTQFDPEMTYVFCDILFEET